MSPAWERSAPPFGGGIVTLVVVLLGIGVSNGTAL